MNFPLFISFFTSDILGEGGMICCKNQDDYEIIKSLRSHGWLRGHKNEKKIASNYPNLDKRFIFPTRFNLRPTEISAAIGYYNLLIWMIFIS